MASVDWQKNTSVGKMKATLRHCLIREGNHSNKDINPALEHLNDYYPGSGEQGYQEAVRRFESRIQAHKDGGTYGRARANRVDSISVEIPCPNEVPDELRKQFIDDAFTTYRECLGLSEDAVVAGAYHADEVHDYLDKDGSWRTSLCHGHFVVIPEVTVDGVTRVNAKQFMSRTNMQKANKAVDRMARNNYGIQFLRNEPDDPDKGKDVEQLKRETRTREAALRQELDERAYDVAMLQQELVKKEMKLRRLNRAVERMSVYVERLSQFEREDIKAIRDSMSDVLNGIRGRKDR